MTKRRSPKAPEPFPAFRLVTIVLVALSLTTVVLLDYLSQRKGDRSYIFPNRIRAENRELPKAGPPAGAQPEVRTGIPGATEPPAPRKEPAAKRGVEGRVALIVDDMGNSLEALDDILGLKEALTVSVLPYGAFAAETARRAHEAGLEVLLHLPLESVNNHESMDNTEGMILAGMSPSEIVRAFEESFGRVPHAAGTNNHMGSRFTGEADPTRVLLSLVKQKGLFFVDSRTTADTVAYSEARKLGIPAAERDVFLDADPDRGRIGSRLIELFKAARKKGRAVGICHPYPETLAILKTSFRQYSAYGLEVVPVSRLLQK